MKARADRANRAPQDLGSLRIVHLLQVAQDDYLAVMQWQRQNCTPYGFYYLAAR
jgi:hypothetical protein